MFEVQIRSGKSSKGNGRAGLAPEERGPRRAGSDGFALIEVIVASAIAVVAVLGLAYSFSVGRAQIDRFKVARAALAAAQDQMERLTTFPPTDPNLTIGQHPASPQTFTSSGVTLQEDWTVGWFDDPEITGSQDLKRVTMRVYWTQGPLTDTLRLTRLFPQ